MASTNVQGPPDANVVGNAFVSQYYNVLHQTPHVAHRFYTDESKLTRADPGPDGAVETITSQHEIHAKVMSMQYGGYKAEIKTVDSQESLKGGVLVMVTGSLSSKITGKRNFVQTFFLAPQEKGYFVLNDVFRYLDDGSDAGHGSYTMANGGVSESAVSADAGSFVFLASPSAKPSVAEEQTEPVPVNDTIEEGYVLAEAQDEPEPEPEHIESVEDAEVSGSSPVEEPVQAAPAAEVPSSDADVPKKSYAAILRKEAALQLLPRVSPPKVIPAAGTAPAPAARAPSHEPAEEGPASDGEVDKRGVYVKNLPMNVSESQLEAEFKNFGPIRPGGVQVRTLKQQGYCYAFVDFQDPQSAQNAIQASASGIQINGRAVFVEERRATTGPRGGSRGGSGGGGGGGEGRGRGGRGSYSGGRSDNGRGNYAGRGGRGGDRDVPAAAVAPPAPQSSSSSRVTSDDEGFRQRPQRRSSSNRNGGGRPE